MIAISFKKDQMSKLVLEPRDYDFWTNLAKIIFRWLQSYLVLFERDCNHIQSDSEVSVILQLSPIYYQDCIHIMSPLSKSLQSNLVVFAILIVIISSSLFWSRFQSYLILIITVIVIIFGPQHQNYCNHKWYSPIFIKI